MPYSRRAFLKDSARLAALVKAGSLPALSFPEGTRSQGGIRFGGDIRRTIGIQIGPDSLVDEGTEKALDILEEKPAVNTLFLSTFTYDRGIIGRPGPGKNYPGHGVEESDRSYFHGGNYATPHAQYYTKTAIKGGELKAPDLGKLDILTEVLPKAKKRGMKVICSIQDGFNYPEIMAYNQLFDIGKHQILKDIYTSVKSIRKDLEVGFHIEHTNSFNPLYRATRNYAELATMADFLKIVVYNNCGGERYVNFIHNIYQTVFRDVPPGELMKMNNHLLNYADEAPMDQLAAAGLSPDYVMRETRRAKAGVEGKCRVLPGIDINIPTGEKSRKASPEDTYAATMDAFKGGADGVILSRKYSEMRLENLAAAGRAVRDATASGT